MLLMAYEGLRSCACSCMRAIPVPPGGMLPLLLVIARGSDHLPQAVLIASLRERVGGDKIKGMPARLS